MCVRARARVCVCVCVCVCTNVRSQYTLFKACVNKLILQFLKSQTITLLDKKITFLSLRSAIIRFSKIFTCRICC